uniref:NADH-ubiquinone oxidoreductase chain 4L n=1 Tax=Homonota fasciata TaxID=401549 RepID=A0A1Y1CC89_9SAUR|nr:NADH dehydrogenase subunit 4L [Homonota fasciata]
MTMELFASATAFALGLAGLTLHRTHLVSALLCIEALVLALFVALTTASQISSSTTTTPAPIALLALAACEAGTGLALLVASARTHSPNYLKTLNLLKC